MVELFILFAAFLILVTVFGELFTGLLSYFSETESIIVILLAAWLLMGCVTQSTETLCAGTTCANYTHAIGVNASVPPLVVPEASPSPAPSFAPQPAPLFELNNEVTSLKLGQAFTFEARFDFGPDSENLSRAEIGFSKNGENIENLTLSNSGGNSTTLSFSVIGKRVDDYQIALKADVYYSNGSLFDSLDRGFTVTVEPLMYYRNEWEGRQVNASSKAAQSFTLDNEANVTQIGVYGLKKSSDALMIELCPDLDGEPGPTQFFNTEDASGVPSESAWYSTDYNAVLAPGKYWIVITDQGNFEWSADLYGENAESDSLYRYGGAWVNDSRDKFFKVS